MADEREPAPWASSGGFGSLSTSPAAQAAQDTASTKPQAPKRKLVTVGGVLRWTGTTVLLVTALGLFGAAGAVTSIHEADLAERGAGVAVAQKRITNAEKAESGLPAPATAERSLVRAGEDVASVATTQNTYLANSGPLSFEGVPLEITLPTGKTQVYTEEERTEMAETIRKDAITGLDRTLTQFFSKGSTDKDGFNAAGDWSPAIEGLLKREDVSGYSWVPVKVTGFTSDLTTNVAWILTDPAGATAGWATAQYSFKDNRFSELRLFTAAAAVADDAADAPAGTGLPEGTEGSQDTAEGTGE